MKSVEFPNVGALLIKIQIGCLSLLHRCFRMPRSVGCEPVFFRAGGVASFAGFSMFHGGFRRLEEISIRKMVEICLTIPCSAAVFLAPFAQVTEICLLNLVEICLMNLCAGLVMAMVMLWSSVHSGGAPHVRAVVLVLFLEQPLNAPLWHRLHDRLPHRHPTFQIQQNVHHRRQSQRLLALKSEKSTQQHRNYTSRRLSREHVGEHALQHKARPPGKQFWTRSVQTET